MILRKIADNSEWLEKKAKQDRCVHISKINAMRGSLYGYSLVLKSLKDRDLEELAKEIEKIKEKLGVKEW